MDRFNITDSSLQKLRELNRANKDLHKTLTAGRSANSPYNFRENERSDVSFDSFTGMMSPADRRRLLEEAESMIEEEDERFKDSNHLHAISEDELDEFDHSLYMKNMEATNKERFAKFDRIANFGRKELNYDSTLGDSAQSSPQQSSSWSISFEDAMEDAQILVDVVNGNYTLEDIIGEIPGYEAPNSTLLIQQFHNVFKKNIKNIKTLLKSEGENQYFKDLDLNKIHHMTPVSMQTDILNASTTAADMIAGLRHEHNEALSAMDALNNAEILIAAEKKLEKVYCAAMRRANMPPEQRFDQDENSDYTIDDILAADPPIIEKENAQFEYSMKYDVSYMPNSDPDVYNPLEIISYIGYTRPNTL